MRSSNASISKRETLGDRTWSAYIHLVLSAIRIGQGKPAQAREILEEGLMLYHEVGSPLGTEFDASIAHYLGRAARVQGDLEQARANYEQSLALYRQIGDTLGVAVVLNALGSVAAARGDDAMAQELFAQSVPLVRTTGDRYDLANVQVEVGLTMVRRGDIARGQDLLLQGLRLWGATLVPGWVSPWLSQGSPRLPPPQDKASGLVGSSGLPGCSIHRTAGC